MGNDSSDKSNKVKIMYVRSDPQADHSSRKNDHQKRNDTQRRSRKPDQYSSLKYSRKGEESLDSEFVAKKHTKSARPSWQGDRQQHIADSDDGPFGIWSKREKQAKVTALESDESKSDDSMATQRYLRETESRIYGENACLAIFDKRPQDIVRAYFLQENTIQYRKTTSWMASQKLAYHVIESDEMAKIAKTEHHEGVCFIIKKRKTLSVHEYLLQAKQKDCIIAVEQIGNPYNLGGLLRTAAFFGVGGVLLRNSSLLDSGVVSRIAEGGNEYINPIETEDIAADLARLQQAGYQLLTIDYTSKQEKLNTVPLMGKIVLLLTDGRQKLAKNLQSLVDITLPMKSSHERIGGLNIAVATGIVLADWNKQPG